MSGAWARASLQFTAKLPDVYGGQKLGQAITTTPLIAESRVAGTNRPRLNRADHVVFSIMAVLSAGTSSVGAPISEYEPIRRGPQLRSFLARS
jgi:hypothetical protein